MTMTNQLLLDELDKALSRNPGKNVYQVMTWAIQLKQATKRLPGLTNTDIYLALKQYNKMRDKDSVK